MPTNFGGRCGREILSVPTGSARTMWHYLTLRRPEPGKPGRKSTTPLATPVPAPPAPVPLHDATRRVHGRQEPRHSAPEPHGHGSPLPPTTAISHPPRHAGWPVRLRKRTKTQRCEPTQRPIVAYPHTFPRLTNHTQLLHGLPSAGCSQCGLEHLLNEHPITKGWQRIWVRRWLSMEQREHIRNMALRIRPA